MARRSSAARTCLTRSPHPAACAADTVAHRLAGPLRHQATLTGGGGTDMAEAITTALAVRPPPDLAVVITDGLTPWPVTRPSRDVIVALLPSPLPRPAPPPWAHMVEVSPPP